MWGGGEWDRKGVNGGGAEVGEEDAGVLCRLGGNVWAVSN
jgi:hypothetical protein